MSDFDKLKSFKNEVMLACGILLILTFVIIAVEFSHHANPNPPTPNPSPHPGPHPEPRPEPKPEPTKEEVMISELVHLHNEARVKHGLKELKISDKLMKSAMREARCMVDKESMSHFCGGISPFARMKVEGYNYGYAGENIAYGQSNPEEVMSAWMSDLPHRWNILGSHFHDIGCAVVFDKHNRPYWSVDLGQQMGEGSMPEAINEDNISANIGASGNTMSITNFTGVNK